MRRNKDSVLPTGYTELLRYCRTVGLEKSCLAMRDSRCIFNTVFRKINVIVLKFETYAICLSQCGQLVLGVILPWPYESSDRPQLILVTPSSGTRGDRKCIN